MTSLDDPRRIVDPSSVPVWPTAIRYGGIVALILVLLGLIMHFTGMNDPASQNPAAMAIGCITYLIITAGCIMAIKKHRDADLGGAITMGRAIGVGTATALITGLIGGVWAILYMSVIAPDMGEKIKESMLQNAQPGQEGMMETMSGLMTNPFMMFAMTLIFYVIWGLISSLIGGAILKKDPAPNV